MKSDEEKIYMKIVALDEIYNFVVNIVFIWSQLDAQIIVWNLKQLFSHLNDFKWKTFQLQNCRYHQGLQFSYKLYPHPISYEKIMNFWR